MVEFGGIENVQESLILRYFLSHAPDKVFSSDKDWDLLQTLDVSTNVNHFCYAGVEDLDHPVSDG